LFPAHVQLPTPHVISLPSRSIPKVKTDSILNGWSKDIAFVRACVAGAIARSKAAGKGIEPSELREAVWEASKAGPPHYRCKYTECANERPSFLVCVMQQLSAMLHNRPLRIFDAAAGWGDRLIAAMVVDAERYVAPFPRCIIVTLWPGTLASTPTPTPGRVSRRLLRPSKALQAMPSEAIKRVRHYVFVTVCTCTRSFATGAPVCSCPTIAAMAA
jgi:hypothetical protein